MNKLIPMASLKLRRHLEATMQYDEGPMGSVRRRERERDLGDYAHIECDGCRFVGMSDDCGCCPNCGWHPGIDSVKVLPPRGTR